MTWRTLNVMRFRFGIRRNSEAGVYIFWLLDSRAQKSVDDRVAAALSLRRKAEQEAAAGAFDAALANPFRKLRALLQRRKCYSECAPEHSRRSIGEAERYNLKSRRSRHIDLSPIASRLSRELA